MRKSPKANSPNAAADPKAIAAIVPVDRRFASDEGLVAFVALMVCVALVEAIILFVCVVVMVMVVASAVDGTCSTRMR